ncbi:MAG: magnesium-translocating P-type ATPase [Acidobacteriota bacterium]
MLGLARDALLTELATTAAGLTDAEAAARLARCGANELEPPVRRTLIVQLARRLIDPLVAILIVAAGVSALAGARKSAVLVLVIVAASVAIETVQGRRAQRTADSLRARLAPTATVVRDGTARTILRRELVPGDVIELEAGDLVPGDARLLDTRDLHVHQAALTGESMPVERLPIVGALAVVSPADGDGVVFAGTSIVSGRGRAVVAATGRGTMFGELADQLAGRARPTEFDRGIARFGVLILETVVLLLVIVLGSAIVMHRDPVQALLFAVALAVGLTPEFLPMITTVTLAAAASHMARRHVIVKRLAAIQNLGSIDVLCTDKTGTITAGEMTLARWVDAAGHPDDRVRALAHANAYFETGVGNAIDVALRRCLPEAPPYAHVDEIPFDFERRCASVVVEDGSGRLLIAKGAPEQLIASCALDEAARRAALALADELAADGSRVIAIATRRVETKPAYRADDEHELELAGFLAFADPPAPEVARTIGALRADGVDVKIITGDAELVARAVCKHAGIALRAVLSGAEIERMTDPALAEQALRTDLFVRVTPMQKRRILAALASRGKVVGYMGDGINDAPSLRAADVGISVAGAVDIAREAADIVLTERDLRVLHAGIVEGRRALGNVMKYLLMETSSNFGNMLSMAAAVVLLPFLPMLPVQVLLNNFLYDVAQLTIPTDRVDPAFLRRPRRWNIDLVRRFMVRIGPISSIFDLVTFGALIWLFHADEALFHTGWFVESVLTQILVLFVIRKLGSGKAIAPSRPLVASSLAVVGVAIALPFSPLAGVLGFVAPPAALLAFVAATIAAYLVLVAIVKARTHVLRERRRSAHHVHAPAA